MLKLGGCRPQKIQSSHLKGAGNRFRSSVCIYGKSMHEVRRLIPKMREMFTNRLSNVSASIIARAKRRCLVKYVIFDNLDWHKLIFCWHGTENRVLV